MNIPVEIVVLFLTVWLAIQGWSLATIVKMQIKIAALEQSLRDCQRLKLKGACTT